ncbi:hypothetical protein DsansV1_C35g0227741 [Dioscorea sansibarensis]
MISLCSMLLKILLDSSMNPNFAYMVTRLLETFNCAATPLMKHIPCIIRPSLGNCSSDTTLVKATKVTSFGRTSSNLILLNKLMPFSVSAEIIVVHEMTFRSLMSSKTLFTLSMLPPCLWYIDMTTLETET